MAIDFDSKRHMGAFREAISVGMNPVIQVKFPYNIHPEYLKAVTTNLGSVTQADSMAHISTGAATSSSAQMLTKDLIVYQPGQGITVRFTALFTEGVTGSTQMVGIGDELDGYFIGFNGDQFSVLRRANGIDYWTSLDLIGDGQITGFLRNLDFTKGNIFQIQYQWLGFGQITYSVFDSIKQRYTILHTDNYPNNHVVPSTYNPSFPLCAVVENTTNNTDLVVKTASMAAFVEGKGSKLTHRHAVDNSKTITSETPILTIRSIETFVGKANRGIVFPDIVSMAADGTKNTKFRIYLEGTLGGTPSWTDVATGDSVVEYDTSATSITGGKMIASSITAKNGSAGFQGSRMIKLRNLETLTVTAESASSTLADAAISFEEMI